MIGYDPDQENELQMLLDEEFDDSLYDEDEEPQQDDQS